MKSTIDRIADHSTVLNKTITRDRVTAHLEAGHSAATFTDTLSLQERLGVNEVEDLLTSPGLTRTIRGGRLTFAMIRPHQELGKGQGSDSQIADQITKRITDVGRFRVVLNLPWPVSQAAFGEFYGHVKEKLIGIEKTSPDGTQSNAWDLFERFSTTGATSFMVLDGSQLQRELRDGHKTWQLWRTYIGATNPSNALPGTIRKEFGSDDNNIVHGSDSVAAVHSDIRWMSRQLRQEQI